MSIDDADSLPPELLSELRKSFAYKQARDIARRSHAKATLQPDKRALVTSKRSQIIEISLTGIALIREPYGLERMARTLANIDPWAALTWEDAVALERIIPTSDEVEAVRTLRANEPDLGPQNLDGEAERYVWHISGVPTLARKLRLVVMLRLFTQLTNATAGAIDDLNRAGRQVLLSPMLRRALCLCLQVGNELNRGTARGGARGFDIEVLPSLAGIKSNEDTSVSLMHWLATKLREGDEVSDDKDVGLDENGSRAVGATRLAEELSLVPEPSEAADFIGQIEEQMHRLREELKQARAELSLLPPLPPAPDILEGFPRAQVLPFPPHGSPTPLLLTFAADEICTVHWVLLPAYKKEPSFHAWGQPLRPPEPEDVRLGLGRDSRLPVACGSIDIEEAGKPHFVVVFFASPPGTTLTVYSIAEDTFGWDPVSIGAALSELEFGSESYADPDGLQRSEAEPWVDVARARIEGRRLVLEAEDEEGDEEGTARPTPESAGFRESSGALSPLYRSVPEVFRVNGTEVPVEPDPTAPALPVPGVDEEAEALLLLSLISTRQLPGEILRACSTPRPCSGGTSAVELHMPLWRALRAAGLGPGGKSVPKAVAKVDMSRLGWGSEAEGAGKQRRTKGFVEGLLPRFLLDAFVEFATRTQARLNRKYERTQSTLLEAADFLTISKDSHGVIDHLAGIGVLRAFLASLKKCDDENTERIRVAAETEAKRVASEALREKRLSRHSKGAATLAHQSTAEQTAPSVDQAFDAEYF